MNMITCHGRPNWPQDRLQCPHQVYQRFGPVTRAAQAPGPMQMC